MDPSANELADRLAQIHERLVHPPGVMVGVIRVPILDPILDELDAVVAGSPGRALPTVVVVELERLAELFTLEMLGTAQEALQRRVRIVELLREADGGRIPVLVADGQDPFGLELRALLESDDGLRACLGRLHPLLARATSVAPTASWVRDAAAVASAPEGPELAGATQRILAGLLRAPITSRPDLLIGGVRPINQRLARGLLWFASVAIPDPAELLGAVGLRMGTSGRNDAVVRDVALANTCAALLGAADDPAAPAVLASMRSQVTNRVVLKQVDRALETIAARAGASVEDVIDLALPTFGLDERSRLEVDLAAARALLEITPEGAVAMRWQLADGSEASVPPESLATAEPAAVADIDGRVAAIGMAIAEEGRRFEDRLGSVRSWPQALWRQRFIDHPVAGPFARRLVWIVDDVDGDPVAVLPETGGWVGLDERPIAQPVGSVAVRLWHPAEASPAAVAAWRATLASRAVRQPFQQVDRDVFKPERTTASPSADRRFAGRIVDHTRLHALLRGRGWAVPSLGPWDQGAEATGWRVFDDGLRAELRYQAVDQVPTGERVERARIVAVRFVRTGARATSQAEGASIVPLERVPPRAFSEAIRDVSLVVVVAELPQPP